MRDAITIDEALAVVRLHELHAAGAITNLPASIDVEEARRIVARAERDAVRNVRIARKWIDVSIRGLWASRN